MTQDFTWTRMMNMPLILRLNQSGMPIDWVTPQVAACIAVKDQIIWHMGEIAVTLHGGFNNHGVQSTIEIPAIIATHGEVFFQRFTPSLDNNLLFRRDGNICMYCGNTFHDHELTRDHITPTSRGGVDRWSNVVTACKRCNHRKGAREPDEASMPLLAIPYAPNHFEFLYLANRRILVDQMVFLKNGFSKNWRHQ